MNDITDTANTAPAADTPNAAAPAAGPTGPAVAAPGSETAAAGASPNAATDASAGVAIAPTPASASGQLTEEHKNDFFEKFEKDEEEAIAWLKAKYAAIRAKLEKTI